MLKREKLIRQHLDGELSPAQEEELRRMAEDDTELAQALSRALSLQDALKNLPPVKNPGAPLIDKIMQTLPAKPGPIIPWYLFLRPVTIPLGPLIVLLIAFIGVGLTLSSKPWRTGEAVLPISASTATARTETACSTPPPSRIMVRFLLKAPQATQVSLAGDFNNWSTQETLLSDPDGDGMWTITLSLSPGKYQYKFLVDHQQWVVDPEATAYLADGFGGKNALLIL